MSVLNRVRCTWAGAPIVGPGVSTFYFAEAATGFQADLVTFFDALTTRFPTGLAITIPAEGDQIESTDGSLVGGWAEGTNSSKVGSSGSVYAAGVGARVVWGTNGFTNGRRVRGSTFLAPLVSDCLATDGTLNDTARASIETAANALRTAQTGDFVIWQRPRGATAGASSSVLTATVPDKIAWLRSRKT